MNQKSQIRAYPSNPWHTCSFFLDEVQNLENWELWVNSLHRRGYNLLITGSNAKLLSGELATHLTGRHISKELFPFSFREYLGTVGSHFRDEYTEEERGMILNHLKKYMEMGGFPEVVVKGYDHIYLHQETIVYITATVRPNPPAPASP